MLPMLAAAALFAAPVTDGELASVAASAQAPATSAGKPAATPGISTSVAQEQMDNWWADDGAALIAEAVRPRPAMPSGFVLLGLAPAAACFRFVATMSAFTES